MKQLIGIALLVGLIACDQNKLETKGVIKYSMSQSDCSDSAISYWLLEMKSANMSDSVLFDSKKLGRKFELNVSTIDTSSDLFYLLSALCQGDSIYLEMPADSFYPAMKGSTPIKLKNKNLKVWATMSDKLTQVQYQTHKQLFEKESIKKYVQQFRWNAVYDTATGIYYEKLKQTRGAAQDYRKAKFKYVMKTINDDLIAYSKEGDPLLYSKDDKTVLKGIKFIANLLSEGESLRAIIPSSMAFGPDGNDKIPGHYPIIVELELLEKVE